MNRIAFSLAATFVASMFPLYASAEDPYEKADDTWISISGTVGTVTADSFMLDYGDGLVTVEMDDWDRDADAFKLAEGENVTVNGMVDDDMFETTTIEANSVYVERLNTYYYASAADEEDTFGAVHRPRVKQSNLLFDTA